MESHPATELFPLMTGAAFEALVEDVRAHGMLEPITLLDNKVLDGRNRLRACEEAKVEPRFVEWQDDGVGPVEWVVAKNLQRRHLTTAQRAALALDLLPHLEAEAKERQRGGQGGVLLSPETDEARGRSDEKAADLVGVGRTTVATAKAIRARPDGEEVIEQMRRGEMNISQAARDVGLARGASKGATLDNGTRDSTGRSQSAYYGKGDKFVEATEPLRRYLKAWRKRDFAFRHTNPKEAARRLKVLDEISEGLEAARADLATRATQARLRV